MAISAPAQLDNFKKCSLRFNKTVGNAAAARNVAKRGAHRRAFDARLGNCRQWLSPLSPKVT
jgi:hypothetical protein